MMRRVRRIAVLVAFGVASAAMLATTPAYSLLGGERNEVISLTPADPAAVRSFGIALSAAALPDIDGLLASRTYGQVVVAIDEDDAAGIEIAVPTSRPGAAPAFVPAAGEHVVFDAGECDVEHECRRGVDVVLRLAEGAAAADVDLTVRSAVYYPASSLPVDATLTYTRLDEPARSVTVHDPGAEASGEAVLDPARPLDITIRYTPAGGTVLRLHGGELTVTYDPGVAAASGASPAADSVLGIGVHRGTNVETVALAPLENLALPIVPIAGCLANCELTYRLVLTPSPPATSPTAKLTWSASAWVFVLTEPGGSPPRLEMDAVQAAAGG